MTASRLMSLALSLASFGFVALAYFQRAVDLPSLLLIAGAGVILIFTAMLGAFVTRRENFLLWPANIVFVIAVLVVLLLQFDQERLLSFRLGLSVLFMAGLLSTTLAIRGRKRRSRRHLMHDYYDF